MPKGSLAIPSPSHRKGGKQPTSLGKRATIPSSDLVSQVPVMSRCTMKQPTLPAFAGKTLNGGVTKPKRKTAYQRQMSMVKKINTFRNRVSFIVQHAPFCNMLRVIAEEEGDFQYWNGSKVKLAESVQAMLHECIEATIVKQLEAGLIVAKSAGLVTVFERHLKVVQQIQSMA